MNSKLVISRGWTDFPKRFAICHSSPCNVDERFIVHKLHQKLLFIGAHPQFSPLMNVDACALNFASLGATANRWANVIIARLIIIHFDSPA